MIIRICRDAHAPTGDRVVSRMHRFADERGHDVVVVVRSTGVDLLTGEGLAPRLVGIDTVVDTSNVGTGADRRPRRSSVR